MQTPGPYQIRVALETALFAALQAEHDAGGLVICATADDIALTDAGDIAVRHVVAPGKVQAGEHGGPEALAEVPGVYTVTLGCPTLPEQVARGWRLCQVITKAFYRARLPIDGCDTAVICGDPWTTNVGEVENRILLSVTCPWWAWTGGFEE